MAGPRQYLEKLTSGVGNVKHWEAKARESRSHVSKEATAEGRFIFQCLQKSQYECEWQNGVNIWLPDARVCIEPPYTPESCTGERAVKRIRIIVS